jgi:hypothetical protein
MPIAGPSRIRPPPRILWPEPGSPGGLAAVWRLAPPRRVADVVSDIDSRDRDRDHQRAHEPRRVRASRDGNRADRDASATEMIARAIGEPEWPRRSRACGCAACCCASRASTRASISRPTLSRKESITAAPVGRPELGMGFCGGADLFGGQRGTHADTIYRCWAASRPRCPSASGAGRVPGSGTSPQVTSIGIVAAGLSSSVLAPLAATGGGVVQGFITERVRRRRAQTTFPAEYFAADAGAKAAMDDRNRMSVPVRRRRLQNAIACAGSAGPRSRPNAGHRCSWLPEVSCQIPRTLPAGSAKSATRSVPSGYGGVTTCPPWVATAASVSSTSAT